MRVNVDFINLRVLNRHSFMPVKYFIFVSLICIVLGAQTLTLEQTIDYAVKNSPQYQIIYKEKEITRAQGRASYGAVLPQLSYGYTEATVKSPDGEPIDLGPLGKISLSAGDEIKNKATELSVQQLLFSVGGIAAVKAGWSVGKLTNYTYADAKEQFVLSVKKAFFDLQMVNQLKELNQELTVQTAHYVRNAEIMFDNGLIARNDMLNARIQLYEAQKNQTNADKMAALAGYNLNTLIGMSVTQNITLAKHEVIVDESLLTRNFDATALAEGAYKKKPSFLAFHEAVELNNAEQLGAWGASLPAVYYSYSQKDAEYDPKSPMTPDGITETWAISARWNFFAGGSNLFKIHEKKNNSDKFAEQEKMMRNYVLIEIQSAVDDLRAQVQNVMSARVQDSLADESLRIAQINFESGNGTTTQLNDALIQKQGAATNMIKAMYDYEYARAKLNYAAGQEIL